MTRFYKIYLQIVNNCCNFAKSCVPTSGGEVDIYNT
jgi:hypothetical protein